MNLRGVGLEVICKYCGNESTNDTGFCGKCGKPLEDVIPVIREEDSKPSSVWDKLFVINAITCGVIIAICMIVIAVLYFAR